MAAARRDNGPREAQRDGDTPVKGGTLNMLGAGDVDYMDPNVSYYSVGYLNLRMWSTAAVHLPGRAPARRPPSRCRTWPPTSRPTPTAGSARTARPTRSRSATARKWNTTPARQVTAEDMVRGVKRTCNPVQPFGGIPDFADLIVGYQAFCDGFAKVAQTPAAIADYIDKTPLPGVVAKDDRPWSFHAHPAGHATSSTC